MTYWNNAEPRIKKNNERSKRKPGNRACRIQRKIQQISDSCKQAEVEIAMTDMVNSYTTANRRFSQANVGLLLLVIVAFGLFLTTL